MRSLLQKCPEQHVFNHRYCCPQNSGGGGMFWRMLSNSTGCRQHVGACTRAGGRCAYGTAQNNPLARAGVLEAQFMQNCRASLPAQTNDQTAWPFWVGNISLSLLLSRQTSVLDMRKFTDVKTSDVLKRVLTLKCHFLPELLVAF